MKFDKHKFMTTYTIFVFVALASLDNAVIGMFPPLFSSIARDFGINISGMGIVSALTIFATSTSSLIWGYLADKGKRKRLIITGTIVWSISVFFTAHSRSYMQLLIYQLFTGVGLGCISSIGFSVLTDYIPKKRLGMLMSLWGLSQGFGGIAGSMMASFVAPNADWRTPFKIIALLGTIFMVLYFFIREPQKGAAEPEFKEMVKMGYEYEYSIKLSHIWSLFQKRSNLWLILQGFFMNITTGTLIFLPTLYIAKIENRGYDTGTAVITAGYLYAFLQTGGLCSTFFGYLGDKLQKRTYRARAILGAICISVAMPLYILMFSIPMWNLSLPHSNNPAAVLLPLIREIATNPWMLAMFALAVGATAAQSANSPNWLALITDLNLPEHRATVFSIANLINGIARAMGNALIGVVLAFVSGRVRTPDNYILTMSLFQIFFIPSIISYIMMSKSSGRDIRSTRSILRRRSRA